MTTRSRYRLFKAKEKLRIIEEAENIGNHAAGRKYDVRESCIRDWRKKIKTRLTEKNSNCHAFCGQKARHLELEKGLCDYVDNKRQYRCAVTSEICQFESSSYNQGTRHTGFKATVRLYQVAAGERVLTWLEAGIGMAWQWPTMHNTHMPCWPLLA